MNKKLLALAIAAALAPAAAMADSGNVTIYGQANASVDYVNPGTGPRALNDKAWRVSSNASRVGLKGTEDLGNGLSAIWQVEALVQLDSGTTLGTAPRDSFVGLSSNTAGTAILGRHDTPYKMGTAKLDLFDSTMGDYNAIVGNIDGISAFDSRLGNVMAYISPSFSGFTFAGAAVMANETNNTANTNGKAYSLTGMYDNGPLFASLSYEQAKDISASSTDVTNATLAGVLATLNKADATKLGLGYKFGDATVGFIAERIKVEDHAGADTTRNAFYLNGSYTMGSNVLKAAFGKANSMSDTTSTGAKQYVIGADHNLSKRTSVYALYSKMNNDSDGNYGLGVGATTAGGAFVPADRGQDPSVFSLGMRHAF